MWLSHTFIEEDDELNMWNGTLNVDRSFQEDIPYNAEPEEAPPTEPYPPDGQYTGVVVRAEEALIVVLVLVLWVGAIALFFNRWGKIRMLEPYQPKFHQEHRPSCPMADITAVRHEQHRTSFSKFNMNWVDAERAAAPYRNLLRPRQNSVFVGSTLTVKLNPPRKTKSAMDIQSLLNHETSPGLTSRSMLPMLSVERRVPSRPSSTGYLGGGRRPSDLGPERRPSCSGEYLAAPLSRRPSCSGEYLAAPLSRRPSCSGECLSAAAPLSRRPSCAGDWLSLPPPTRERRPSFNNVLAQVTAERRPSSAMLRITNV